MTERLTEAELESIAHAGVYLGGAAILSDRLVAEVRRLRGLVTEAAEAIQGAHEKLEYLETDPHVHGQKFVYALDHKRGGNRGACSLCGDGALEAEARAIAADAG